MSVYHTSFNYLGINSRLKNLIISHFDADAGEVETNLSLEPIYTDSAFGLLRYDYGAKYNSVAAFRITVIKPDGSDFSELEVRNHLKWLTGTMSNTTLDLLVGEQIKCSFTGRFTNVWQQKMDARTIGLAMEFTSISPFGYSPKQTGTYDISGTNQFQIQSLSDDLSSYVYLKTIYNNRNSDTLVIENKTIGETTTVTGLVSQEVITIDGPMLITSNKAAKIFGDSFNFVFPRLAPGINDIHIKANGSVTFEYVYPIKIGNVAVEIQELNNAIDCDSNPGPGTVVTEHASWENVLNKPHTLGGYGITDAYTEKEIDNKIVDINNTINNRVDELHNADDALDSKIEESQELLLAAIDRVDKSNIDWSRVVNEPTTVSGYGITDAYTKDEINAKISAVYKYKGSLQSRSNLPTTGMVIGDVYNLEDTGMNVAWSGQAWDNLGSVVDLSPYLTKTEANTTYAKTSTVSSITDRVATHERHIEEHDGWIDTLSSDLADQGLKIAAIENDIAASDELVDTLVAKVGETPLRFIGSMGSANIGLLDNKKIGDVVFNSSENKFYMYNGSTWITSTLKTNTTVEVDETALTSMLGDVLK